MASGTQTLPITGSVNVIVGRDAGGNEAAAAYIVDQNGAAFGTVANPTYTAPATPAASIATGQVSVGATATQIVAARAGRVSVVLIQEGTTLVRVGSSAVTLTTGIPLPGLQYASLSIDGGAAVYGIVASGSETVSYVECF